MKLVKNGRTYDVSVEPQVGGAAEIARMLGQRNEAGLPVWLPYVEPETAALAPVIVAPAPAAVAEAPPEPKPPKPPKNEPQPEPVTPAE